MIRPAPHQAAARFALLLVLCAGIGAEIGAGAAEPQTAVPRVHWRAPHEIASGPAFQGRWRMNASVFRFVDDASVAIGPRGVIGVVWVDQSRKEVLFQAYDPDGGARLPAPVAVSRSPEVFSWLPRLVMGGGDRGAVHVLWQEIVFSPGGSHGGEILLARSTDGGRGFGEPLNLSNSGAGDGKGRLDARYWDNGSLDLVRTDDGALLAAWTEYDGRLWVSRSSDDGASFSPPLRITGPDPPARGPTLAAAAGGAVHLAWTVGEDPRARIHLADSADGGRTFGPPRTPLEGNGHADAPKLAVDTAGTLHLVYAESPQGWFEPAAIRYARSRDGARTFEVPRLVSRPAPAGTRGEGYPSIALDGAGRVYLVWELFPAGSPRSRGLGFSYSGDGGAHFAPPTVIPGSADPALGDNGSRQGLLMRKLAVAASGAIVVVNSRFRRADASRIFLHRGRLDDEQ